MRTGSLCEVGRWPGLGQQVDRAGLFDRAGDAAVKLGGDSGHAARQDLAGFAGELAEQVRVGVDHLIDRDIIPADGHSAVGLAEGDTTFDCFRFGHKRSLAEFAMEGAAFQEMVEFHLFETSGRAETFLVTRGDVA